MVLLSAGCYNSEGEFSQAIQEYTLALQHDEIENAGGFRPEKRRIGMHESAEHLIRKTLGVSAVSRLRSACHSQDLPPPIETRAPFPKIGDVGSHSREIQKQEPNAQPQQQARPRSESVPGKRPRKVVQVRVNLSKFASAVPQVVAQANVAIVSLQTAPKFSQRTAASNSLCVEGGSSTTGSHFQSQQQHQALAPRVLAVRAVPKTVRRVTVAL
ncbi:unnamed protein product [Phytophthora fragariaefolia]|uniref:Unnamed protein product n=1 Tax=Phytophthora fragariaefolia TaxID=1490495 RepID=A0A9W6UAN1_9STRA|nr:unnamed protein product [Phytophthora fragariaefolia]